MITWMLYMVPNTIYMKCVQNTQMCYFMPFRMDTHIPVYGPLRTRICTLCMYAHIMVCYGTYIATQDGYTGAHHGTRHHPDGPCDVACV